MKLIALSGKAQAGKDSVADIITELLRPLGWIAIKIPFAQGVKEEAMAGGWDGRKDLHGRTLLQEIGSKRRQEDSLYWVKKAFDIIRANDGPRIVFVITDCRYRNEAEYVTANGGDVWRIERVNEHMEPFDNGLTLEQKAHASETDLDEYPGFLFTLQASNLMQLRDQTRQALMFYDFGLVYART